MTVAPRLPDFYRLTVADWVDLAEESRIVEIINGEIFMAPSPSVRHQTIAKRLMIRLFMEVEDAGMGEVYFAPTGLKLRDDVVLEPDLMVVLARNRASIKAQFVEAADLVVEILSPGTAGRDVGIKLQRYEEAQIPEYWIVDPQRKTVEVLALVEGAYVSRGVLEEGAVLTSEVLPGLSIELAEIWATP